MKYGIALLIASTLASTIGMGCQERGEPIPMLTQMQWRRVQEHVLTEAPEVAHPVDAVFGDQFRLIGWDIEPATPEAGEEVTITYFWEVLEETDERWRIFVHLDSNSRQNLDHEAIGDAYPSVYWSQGEIIRDEVTARLDADIEEGDVEVFVGFFTDDDRMDVTRAGEGVIDEDGRLSVGSFSVQWEAPSYEIRRTQSEITLDGRLNEPAWRSQRYRTDNWVNPGNGDEVEGLNTWAGMVWDNDYLYIAINSIDRDVWSTFVMRDENLWEEEVVEVYLDPASTGENYIELQVNPLNTVFDALFTGVRQPDFTEARNWNIPGLQTAVHINGTSDDREDRDRSWSVEIQIPLASLVGLPNLPPQNGDQFRVNFYRYDRPDADTTTTLAWSPIGGGSFHNPDRFGIARFRGNATAPAGSGEAPGSGAAPDGSGAEAGSGSQLGIRTVNDGDSTVQVVPEFRRPRDGRPPRDDDREEREDDDQDRDDDEANEGEEATNEGE